MCLDFYGRCSVCSNSVLFLDGQKEFFGVWDVSYVSVLVWNADIRAARNCIVAAFTLNVLTRMYWTQSNVSSFFNHVVT